MITRLEELRVELDKTFDRSSRMVYTYHSMPNVDAVKKLSERILALVTEISKINMS